MPKGVEHFLFAKIEISVRPELIFDAERR